MRGREVGLSEPRKASWDMDRPAVGEDACDGEAAQLGCAAGGRPVAAGEPHQGVATPAAAAAAAAEFPGPWPPYAPYVAFGSELWPMSYKLYDMLC
jgi:hypothetical protein